MWSNCIKAVILATIFFSQVAISAVTKELEADRNPAQRPVISADKAHAASIVASVRAGSRTVAVGDYGIVLLSDDGKTFKQSTDVPTSTLLTSVTFIDEHMGWAVGHDGVIIQTADGGESWKLLHSDPERNQTFLSVWFENSRHGITVGQFGLALETFDGGMTWNPLIVTEDEDVYDFHLNAIFGNSSGTLFIAGEGGVIHRSDDSGKTWKLISTGARASLWAGTILDNNSVVVVGMRGHLYRSVNNGETWVKIDTGTTESLTDIIQLSDGRILVVGYGGAELSSNNKGKSFQLRTRIDRAPLTSVVESGNGPLLYSLAGVVGVAENSKTSEKK